MSTRPKQRRTPRPVPKGMATVQVVIRLGNGMRLRYQSQVGEAEAHALWGTLIEHAGERGVAPTSTAP